MKYEYTQAATMLDQMLRMVKLDLPKNCTFLAPVKKSTDFCKSGDKRF
jgi:hypothetical protein